MERRVRRLVRCFSRFAVVLALAAPFAGTAQDEQQQGTALIARARSLETLLAEDTGPFHLRAHVTLFGMVSGASEGEYLLLAASPDRWFEQTRFPWYGELSGLCDGERWRRRNVADKPFRIHEVTQLLNVAHHLELPADARVEKLVEKEVGGAKALCIRVSPTAALWQKECAGRAAISPVEVRKDSEVALCFDAGTGLLLSATYQAELPRFEYEGQVTLGSRVFPRVMRCYEGKELVVEATVEELVPEEAQDPAGFVPPSGVSRWPDCASPDPPQLLVKAEPREQILAYSRAHRQYGTVYCLTEVGIDGRIHDFTFLKHAPGGPAVAVKEAVKGWTYRPATCGDDPVPVTVYLAYTVRP
jgi:hypothetical protein